MKRIISGILIICMLFPSTSLAKEVSPYTTNILQLSASLVLGDGWLCGGGTGAYTGTGLHAIYECHIQYQTSSGAWYNVDDGRVTRSYTSGEPYTFSVYYYTPEVGTTYRFHIYMQVVDSNGYLHDAETINSDSYVYRG